VGPVCSPGEGQREKKEKKKKKKKKRKAGKMEKEMEKRHYSEEGWVARCASKY
jgi:hypothetical protein